MLIIVFGTCPNFVMAYCQGYDVGTNVEALESSERKMEIRFKNGEDKESSWIFTYEDSFFSDSSYVYNHELAKISLGFSLAAGTAPGSRIYWGEDGRDVGRQEYIKEIYENLGFTKDEYYLYDVNLNNTGNYSALSIAEKDISINGEEFTLVAVVFRGHGYGSEWASNFILGNNNLYHEGFYETSKKAESLILSYLSNLKSDKKIKLWTVGYSRGANIANITTANLMKTLEDNLYMNLQLYKENIYSYTFGASRGILTKDGFDFDEKSLELFKNIFNILNPADVIIRMPIADWGFERYGTDMTFSYPDESKMSSEQLAHYLAVSDIYMEITGEEYLVYEAKSHITRADEIEKLMLAMIPNVYFYERNYQKIAAEIAVLFNTQVPNKNNSGTWEEGSLKDRFFYRYGSKGRTAYLKYSIYLTVYLARVNPLINLLRINSNDVFSTIVVFMALCDLTGFKLDNQTEGFLQQAVKIFNIYTLFSSDNIFVTHYPESYIAWLFSQEDPKLLFL